MQSSSRSVHTAISGYPGGLKSVNYESCLRPTPFARLRRLLAACYAQEQVCCRTAASEVKVYVGPEHRTRHSSPDLRIQPGRPVIRAYEETIGEIVAQERREQIVVEEELTSYPLRVHLPRSG